LRNRLVRSAKGFLRGCLGGCTGARFFGGLKGRESASASSLGSSSAATTDRADEGRWLGISSWGLDVITSGGSSPSSSEVDDEESLTTARDISAFLDVDCRGSEADPTAELEGNPLPLPLPRPDHPPSTNLPLPLPSSLLSALPSPLLSVQPPPRPLPRPLPLPPALPAPLPNALSPSSTLLRFLPPSPTSSNNSCPRARASCILRILSCTRSRVGQRFLRSAIHVSRTSGLSMTSVVPWIGMGFLGEFED
jgi:hypothetical protein